jgi:hypothetical protein
LLKACRLYCIRKHEGEFETGSSMMSRQVISEALRSGLRFCSTRTICNSNVPVALRRAGSLAAAATFGVSAASSTYFGCVAAAANDSFSVASKHRCGSFHYEDLMSDKQVCNSLGARWRTSKRDQAKDERLISKHLRELNICRIAVFPELVSVLMVKVICCPPSS